MVPYFTEIMQSCGWLSAIGRTFWLHVQDRSMLQVVSLIGLQRATSCLIYSRNYLNWWTSWQGETKKIRQCMSRDWCFRGNTLPAWVVLPFRSAANVRIGNIKNAACSLRVQVRCPSERIQFLSRIILQRILMKTDVTNWRTIAPCSILVWIFLQWLYSISLMFI